MKVATLPTILLLLIPYAAHAGATDVNAPAASPSSLGRIPLETHAFFEARAGIRRQNDPIRRTSP